MSKQLQPLVSVIVPCYNVQEYIETCVDSIINQTYKNIEIILVNDGSTDSTLSKINEFSNKDPRVIIVDKKNGGLSSARNAGLDICKGEYIYFVDSDDYLILDAISNLVNYVVEEHADIVVGSMISYHEETNLQKECPITHKMISYNLARDYLCDLLNNRMRWMPGVAAWGKLYNKKCFDNLRFTQSILCEDADILLDVLLRCKKITLIPDYCYIYRIRKESISHSISSKYVVDNASWITKYIDYYETLNDEEVLGYLHLKMAHDLRKHFIFVKQSEKEYIRSLYKKSRRALICNKYIGMKSRLKYLLCFILI